MTTAASDAADSPLHRAQEVTKYDVLAQAVPVYERHWQSAIPLGAWPQRLKECPRDPKGRVWVSRSAVFDIARVTAANATAANCEQTLVAVDAWGTGTKMRSVKRAQKVWATPPGIFPTVVGEKLLEAAHELLDGGGPVKAYQLLATGAGHVNGLGPAFFTKFLYFVGYDGAAGDCRPLILDRYVARGLNKEQALDLPDTGWTPEQYCQYLMWARREMETLGLREDEAEYRIWHLGQGAP